MNRREANVDSWTGALERSAALTSGCFRRAIVLEETESTQDAARRIGAGAGSIVATRRQTAGRGRLGRVWSDPADEGVAATFVVPRAPPERLAIACAVGAAKAVEPFLGRSVGLKWPNDLVVGGKKLAGVLVEQADQLAYIGVGINVAQNSWAAELADVAVSLAQLGIAVERIDVLRSLVVSLAEALGMDDARVAADFARRDVLCGCEAVLSSGGVTIAGRVLRVEAMRGLLVSSSGVEAWLPAALTTVVRVVHRDREVDPRARGSRYPSSM